MSELIFCMTFCRPNHIIPNLAENIKKIQSLRCLALFAYNDHHKTAYHPDDCLLPSHIALQSKICLP